jgi:hypothetical protein
MARPIELIDSLVAEKGSSPSTKPGRRSIVRRQPPRTGCDACKANGCLGDGLGRSRYAIRPSARSIPRPPPTTLTSPSGSPSGTGSIALPT